MKKTTIDIRPPKTHYSKAWQAYQRTGEYKRAINAMQAKGMVQPYIDNILQGAFEAGYNSKRETT